jgi:hypothetical protein
MKDIVEMLRESADIHFEPGGCFLDESLVHDAAAEIETLRGSRDEWEAAAKHYVAENERLRERVTEAENRQGLAEIENEKLREALEKIVRGSTSYASSWQRDLARTALQSKGEK